MLKIADRLLRGELTAREQLSEGRIGASVGTLAAVGAAAGAVYGVAMGLFGVLRPQHATWQQCLADAVKVPALFLVTLVVAFPSLYAFSALANSKLRFGETLKLLLVGVAVNLVVLASLAPVTAFFTVSTTSYAFMVLLNVAFFAFTGAIALAVLGRALRTVFAVPSKPKLPSYEGAASETDTERTKRIEHEHSEWGRYQRASAAPRRIFFAWLAIYAFVGCQTAWILRPFIGSPGLEFQLFRPRSGSFFEAVATALFQFLTGR